MYNTITNVQKKAKSQKKLKSHSAMILLHKTHRQDFTKLKFIENKLRNVNLFEHHRKDEKN